jgi:ABC-type nitrate/sulfonate/bicarbonate transport system substrate-binding protein
MIAPGYPKSAAIVARHGRHSRQPVDLVAFAGASNWPLWIGQQWGFFSEQGIELRINLTPSSIQMAEELYSGAAQIALTSIDNVIAYANGQGEVPLDGAADFFAFMGVDDGLLSVMAQPGIRTIEELRGHILAVDALTTGYALVLRELLSHHNIGDADVKYKTVGTGAERLIALKAGTCAATLLNAPLCLAAEEAGKFRVIRARDVLGSYQGIVGAARRHWAANNETLIEKFIRAFRRSLTWLRDPDNEDAACALLVDRMPVLGAVVDLAYRTLVVDGGIEQSLAVHREGTASVIRLREKFGHLYGRLGGPDRYIEDRFRLAALA